MIRPEYQQRGEAICARLLTEIHKLGFAPGQLAPTPLFDRVRFESRKDPFSGDEALCGSWHDFQGQRIGQLTLREDGTFYAEYDVVLPHPRDPRWFVEGVIAWGRDDLIKAEAKLLPVPGD